MNQLASQIRELLVKNNTSSLVKRCLDVMSEDSFLTFKSTGPLPIEHVRRTTEVRAKTNAQGRGLVEGYDELLRGLKEETDCSVQIYFFDARGDSFTILTDSSTSRLLGVLISREASSGVDRLRGY